MTDDETPTVEVTLGVLGRGEKTIRLNPGESIREGIDDPCYVEVEALEVDAEGSDVDYDVAGTTLKQEDNNDSNREITIKTVRCEQCGERYSKNYSRCPECGTPNTNA